VEAKATLAGKLHTVSATTATYHAAGDFSGNIDIIFKVEPPSDHATVARALRIRVPGLTTWLTCVGSGDESSGVGLTYHHPSLEGASTPASVEVGQTTDDQKVLGHLPCVSAPTP
jgi:hypothetical protein